jgi:hypothetical protein
MKKYLGCLAVLVLAIFFLSACANVSSEGRVSNGEIRDLSTPSTRLVGHWRAELDKETYDFYYGEIDPESGKGLWELCGTSDSLDSIGTYTKLSEDTNGKALTLLFYDILYDESKEWQFEIPNNGLTAKISSTLFTYIDDKTENTIERDLTTPSSRLVGHWRFIGSPIEHYYSEIDKETREGKLITYNRDEKGRPSVHTYKLLEENSMNNSVKLYLAGDFWYFVDLDGLSIRRENPPSDDYLVYISSKLDFGLDN